MSSQPLNQEKFQAVSETLVQLKDVTLFVRQFGEVGPAVVLIHGGPDWEQSYFFPFLMPLAAHCRLFAFDLRGCGRSQKFHDAERYHIDFVVEDLAQLLDYLQLKSAILLGFSYGGRVALRFTDRYPTRVEKLILASTTAYEGFQADLEQWEEYQQRNNADMRHKVQAIWQASHLAPEQKTQQHAEITLPLNIYDSSKLPLARDAIARMNFSGEWLQAWEAGKLSNVQHAPYAERLASLGIPLLILHGEKDMCFPVSVAKRLAAGVPQARLVILPGTGHLAHIEATEAWNEAVIQFIREVI